MTNENIDLAKEHIEIAKDIVVEEGRKSDEDKEDRFGDVEFSLEKAGAVLDELDSAESSEKKKE